MREHLEAAEAATGRTPDRLNVPPVPAIFERQFRLWADLHRGRAIGAEVTPLSWVDLDAYCRVTGERLSAMDLHFVRVIDGEFFASRRAARERQSSKAERANDQRSQNRDRRR